MTLPLALGTVPLPDWLPWWVPALLLVPLALYGLLFLMVPFATFGVKGRLDAIEAQLEELHAMLAHLASRPPMFDRPGGDPAARYGEFEEPRRSVADRAGPARVEPRLRGP